MKKLLFAFALLVLLQLSLCYYLLHGSEKKIAYADAIRLFNEYKFKTDLEKESQGTLQRLKAELDSVGVIYKVNPDNEQVQRMMMEKQQHFTEGCNAVNKTINEKVWERLNVKIQEFGKKEDIEMLIGANGMGTVLYASESRDVTDALVKYVNDNYEKGN